MLPHGMLDYSEITKISEEVTVEQDETGTVIRILHIYLDERDLRAMTSIPTVSPSLDCSTISPSASTRCGGMCGGDGGWTVADTTPSLKAFPLWRKEPATLLGLRIS